MPLSRFALSSRIRVSLKDSKQRSKDLALSLSASQTRACKGTRISDLLDLGLKVLLLGLELGFIRGVVVLGRAGRNFGAGMSGGVGYVLDEAGDFTGRVNPQMVGIEKLADPREIALVQAMIRKHLDYTKSEKARAVLANWDAFVPKFVKVMPKDYKRMLACIERAQASGLTGDEAVLAAFEENARDLSRVGGN